MKMEMRKVRMMSSNLLGKAVAKTALSYKGATQGSKKHKELVKIFNSVKPSGEVATTSDAWCAIMWSACQIKHGLTDKDTALDYNVGRLIDKARKLGIWVERDAYIPRVGDGVVYYWGASANGETTQGASHIGTVYRVADKHIYVVEGNAGDGVCKTRAIPYDYRYIRGFITPKYNAILINRRACKYSYPLGYKGSKKKPRKTYRAAWKKYFPKRKIGTGCHQFVMVVMKSCGYKTMPLSWKKILAYLKRRCTLVKFNHKASDLRKGDIMVYRRVDRKGAHYHIWVVIDVNGKLCMAEARQGHCYPYKRGIKKALKKYNKTWVYRPKEK